MCFPLTVPGSEKKFYEELMKFTSCTQWESNLFMVEGHMHVIVGWFVCHTWKNNNKLYTKLRKLFCNFCSIYVIYICGCGLHNMTWWATWPAGRSLETHAVNASMFIEARRNYKLYIP
jgi:hypothetical protein